MRRPLSGLANPLTTLGRALWLDRAGTFRAAAAGSLMINLVLVITGGAVRLTDSGLGCTTWPRCTDDSYVTTPAMGYHGVIEFTNRTITGVAIALSIAAALAALCQPTRVRRQIGWSLAVVAGIPAQGVIGGITVLTDLNPWVVACHFLGTVGVIAMAYLCWLSAREPSGAARLVVRPPLRALAWLLTAVSAAVLVVGTVVTGSGPHAGNAHARRTGLDPGMVAQLHADLVMLLVGLTIAGWFALRATGAPAGPVRAMGALFIVEMAQGAIGFTQYFTHLPVLLVGLHMAGAAAVWVATLASLTSTRVREPAPRPAPATASPAELASTPA